MGVIVLKRFSPRPEPRPVCSRTGVSPCWSASVSGASRSDRVPPSCARLRRSSRDCLRPHTASVARHSRPSSPALPIEHALGPSCLAVLPAHSGSRPGFLIPPSCSPPPRRRALVVPSRASRSRLASRSCPATASFRLSASCLDWRPDQVFARWLCRSTMLCRLRCSALPVGVAIAI